MKDTRTAFTCAWKSKSVGYTLAVERVAESAQAVQADALALAHIVGQYAGQFGQHGQYVGFRYGTDGRQPFGNLLGLDGTAHGYCQGVIDSEFLTVLFFEKCHNG